MAREYLNLYHSYLQAIEPLTDAERGRLFTALLEYDALGIEPELRGNEKFIFPSMRSQINRDKEKYAKKCQQNRQNGAKGGRATASERYQTLPNAPRTPPKEKEKEKAKAKDNLKDIDRFFAELWELYPKKEGKGRVSDTQKRKLYAIGKDKMEIAIERYKKKLKAEGTEPRYIQQGSTFFNSGYVDYLDDNYKPVEEQGSLDLDEIEELIRKGEFS